MSKTVSTCILETNQVKGKPQENAFFHSLYRSKSEFPDEFLRTAKSTSPIQICALFSTKGPDALSAKLNIKLNEELKKIVEINQKSPVLDFNKFADEVVTKLNTCVCDFIIKNSGTQLQTSMTLVIIEGDVLRVIHVGNTKAVLIRDNKIIALTEEQTVAHKFAKLGAITAEEEKNHPEKDTLAQYFGKLPQDGTLEVEKKVQIKLKENDEICILGLGLAKDIPSQMRNVVLIKPISTEDKAKELISSAFNYGIKTGLSAIIFKIESTFLLPGDAVITSSLETEAALSTEVKSDTDATKDFMGELSTDSDVKDDTKSFDKSELSLDSEDSLNNKDNKTYNKKKSLILNIAIPVAILLVFSLASFGIVYAIARSNHLFDKVKTEEIDYENVYFSIDDEVPVYPSTDVEDAPQDYLYKNQGVRVVAYEGLFVKISYTCGIDVKEGYVLLDMLSKEEIIEMEIPSDPEGDDDFVPDDEFTEDFNPVDITPTPTTTPTPIPVDESDESTESTTTYNNVTVETTIVTTTANTEPAPEPTETTVATEETSEETSSDITEDTSVSEETTEVTSSTEESVDTSEPTESETEVTTETTTETTAETTVPETSETSAAESSVEETTQAPTETPTETQVEVPSSSEAVEPAEETPEA